MFWNLKKFRMPKKTKSRQKDKCTLRNEYKQRHAIMTHFLSLINKIDTRHETIAAFDISTVDLKTVVMDVKRSVAHWDVHRNLSTRDRSRLRDSLQNLVVGVASSIGGFRYYQGVHEVCLVILQAFNGDTKSSIPICRAIFEMKFGSLAFSDFSASLTPLLEALHGLTATLDPELAGILDQSGLGYNFAIPWILTWFAHSVDRYKILTGIFSYLLENKNVPAPLACVYLCCAVILQSRGKIVDQRHDSCVIFRTLQSCPENTNWPLAKREASKIADVFPPEQLVYEFPNLRKTFHGKMSKGIKKVRMGVIFGICFLAFAVLEFQGKFLLRYFI
jgi:hypothetical protein